MKNAIKATALFLIAISVANNASANEFKYVNDGNWAVGTRTSYWDDSKEIIITIESENGNGGILDLKAILSFRCLNKKTSIAYFPRNGFKLNELSYKTNVKFRINKNQPNTHKWSIGEGFDFVGRWNYEAIMFMRKLYNENANILALMAYGEETDAEHRFNISGVKKQIKKIADACNWKL